MIDGINNSVVETDVVPLPEPTGSDENWAGNGFIAKKTILQTTGEGARMSDTVKGRMWSLVNEDKVHYASKAPVGFKVSFNSRFAMARFLSFRDLWFFAHLSFAFRSCARICHHFSLKKIHSLLEGLLSPLRIYLCLHMLINNYTRKFYCVIRIIILLTPKSSSNLVLENTLLKLLFVQKILSLDG